MSEQLEPCPHCRGTDLKIAPRQSYDGSGVVLTCQNGSCIARIWGHDEDDVTARWNRRAPGPKTKAMLEYAAEFIRLSARPTMVCELFQAFIDECSAAKETRQ